MGWWFWKIFFWFLIFLFCIEKDFYMEYANHGFPSPNSSQILTTSPLIQLYTVSHTLKQTRKKPKIPHKQIKNAWRISVTLCWSNQASIRNTLKYKLAQVGKNMNIYPLKCMNFHDPWYNWKHSERQWMAREFKICDEINFLSRLLRNIKGEVSSGAPNNIDVRPKKRTWLAFI